MTDQPRTPKGWPAGGQFTTTGRGEPAVTLTGVPSQPDMDSLGVLYNALSEEFPTAGIGLKLCERRPGGDRYVVLDVIRFPDGERRQGNGTRLLQRLTEHADTHGWTLALSPDPKYGSDVAGLERLYRRHGFIPTRSAAARKHAFGVFEDMLRPPQPPAGQVTEPRPARLDPAVAHHIDTRTLLGLMHHPAQRHLHDIRQLLARQIQAGAGRGRPYSRWQDAWNDLTGADGRGNGQLRLANVPCPACSGRGVDTRHVARNLSRTGNPAICGECMGRRRANVTVQVRRAD